MSYLSALAAGLYHARRETRLHLRLAREVFGDRPVFKLIQRWVGKVRREARGDRYPRGVGPNRSRIFDVQLHEPAGRSET
jgi:hypothetical protein